MAINKHTWPTSCGSVNILRNHVLDNDEYTKLAQEYESSKDVRKCYAIFIHI